MDSTEIFVVIAGVALLALVLWYFFGERERVAARAGAGGVQEIAITVKGGYSPDVVVVRAGSRVRIVQRACGLRRFRRSARAARLQDDCGRVHAGARGRIHMDVRDEHAAR